MKKRTAILAARKYKIRAAPPILRAVFALVLGSGALSAQTGPDLELSRAYTRMTHDNQNLAFDESRALLEAALEFNPANSDALTLLTRLQLENARTREYDLYRSAFEAALEGGRFELLDADRVRMDLAALYERLMQYEKLGDLLDRIPSGKRNAEWFRLRSVAHSRLGRDPQARTAVRRGGLLFPENIPLSLWRIQIDDEYRSFLTGKVDHPDEAPVNEARLSALIEFARTDEERLKLVEAFSALDYQEANGRLWSYRLDQNNREANPFPELMDSWRLLRAAHEFYTEKDKLMMWESFLADIDREIPGDFNRDGFPERYFHLQNGKLREYREDLDQNGVFEQTVLFDAGPGELIIKDDEGTTAISYALYPQVAEIEFDRGGRMTRYLFAPDAYALAVVTVQDMPPMVNLPRGIALDGAELSRLSYSIQTSEAESTIVTRGDLSRADLEGDSKIRAYRSDSGALVLRDIDGDGVSEIREEYRDGRLELLLLDQDENGIFEYRYDVLNEREEWDFDQDGSIDYQTDRRQE